MTGPNGRPQSVALEDGLEAGRPVRGVLLSQLWCDDEASPSAVAVGRAEVAGAQRQREAQGLVAGVGGGGTEVALRSEQPPGMLRTRSAQPLRMTVTLLQAHWSDGCRVYPNHVCVLPV